MTILELMRLGAGLWLLSMAMNHCDHALRRRYNRAHRILEGLTSIATAYCAFEFISLALGYP